MAEGHTPFAERAPVCAGRKRMPRQGRVTNVTRGPSGRPIDARLARHGAAITALTALLLAAGPARGQTAAERDAALGAPLGTALGTPINEAEVRDVAVGAPRPVDRAPFTPFSRTELGYAGQGTNALTPVPPALGQGLRLSRYVTLSPYYRGGAFYDSNVFRDPDEQAVEDVELINTLGIDLAVVGRRFELEAGYAGSSRVFVDQDSWSDEHRARLNFAAVGRAASIRARAALAWLARPDDPRFARATVKRSIYDVGGAVAVRLTRTISLLPEVFGSYTDLRTEEFDFADNATYGGNLLLSLSPRGRVAFFGGVGVRELIYTNSQEARAPDLRIYTLLVGIESRFTRGITGQVRVGYDWSEILERRSFPEDEDPPTGFVTNAALRWQLLRTTALTLDATRQVDFSTTTTPVWRTRVGLGLEQALLSTVGATLNVAWDQIDAIDGGRGRVQSWLISGGLAWAPRPWFQVGVLGSYLTRQAAGAGGGDFDVTRVGLNLTLRY